MSYDPRDNLCFYLGFELPLFAWAAGNLEYYYDGEARRAARQNWWFA